MRLGRSKLGVTPLAGGPTAVGLVEHLAELDLEVEAVGTFTVNVTADLLAELDLEVEGTLGADPAFMHAARLPLEVVGSFAVNLPPLEGRRRVVLVDTLGETIADLEQAKVGDIGPFQLNGIEEWSFTLPVDDPKAHHVLDERIREAQLWWGDLELSWGPMSRPQVENDEIHVAGHGAPWYLTRRHVGKASRENHLRNPSFEEGTRRWNYLHEAYFLDYEALQPGDVRIYAPGRDGRWALELNADPTPWVSPPGATTTGNHTVVPGDTLWDLAATFYGSGTQWWRIYEANQAQIQAGAVAAGLWNPQDPGHWIFPGQVFTIPGISTAEVKAAPPDDGTRWGEVYAYQEHVVTAGQRGLTATLVGWCKVPAAQFREWGVHRRGVSLGRMRTDWRTNNFWTPGTNTWGGARAFYTDVIEHSQSRLDEEQPLDTWVRHECSITVPPGTTRSLIARVTSVDGRVYWDKLSLTYDTAFEAFDTDQATIIAQLVDHAQDPDFDKNDVNLTVEAPPTDVERTLVALHSEHANIWDLIQDYTRYRDGLDVGVRYTPHERIITTHYPRRGVERRNLHLQLERNIAAFRWTFDGEAAASSVIILGTGDGSDREEAAAIDDQAFADGLILELVEAVEPETPVDLLDEIADERLVVVKDPEVLEVWTYPHDLERPERRLIGRLWDGDVVPVTIRKGRRENRWLELPGAVGDYVSTPDTAALDVTGDLDVRVIDITIPDVTPASHDALVSKWTDVGNQRSWLLRLKASTGLLQLWWSTNGADFPLAESTVSLSTVIGDGGTVSIWAIRSIDEDFNKVDVQFLTSVDSGVTWQQLGAIVSVAGATTVNNASTAPLIVGARNGGTTDNFEGAVRRVEVRDGIGGTLVASPDFTTQAGGATSFTDEQGNVWTLNGDAHVATETTGWQFELNADYRVVSVTVRANDSLALVLNRRGVA